MRFFDFLMLAVLFSLLFVGIYFLWLNLPTETFDFEAFYGNLSLNLTQNSSQFYPNMRYVEKEIGYFLSQNCSQKKQKDFREAADILERKTILNFYETDSPELVVSCSNISPEPQETGHFVAGEGGPTTIINASQYSVILLGKIALYRPETCETSQIAVHEILHALGFNHNNNTESIMYPYTNCEQTIDQEIITEIDSIYSQESLPDLIIESITANKTGRFLNFGATVTNNGLASIENSTLTLSVEGELIKGFSIGDLDIGAKRHLTVQNLKIPRNADEITFLIETPEREITKENNLVEIRVLDTA